MIPFHCSSNILSEEWGIVAGANLGIIHPSIVTNFRPLGDNGMHGFSVGLETPIPGLSIKWISRFRGKEEEDIHGFAFEWTPSLLSAWPK